MRSRQGFSIGLLLVLAFAISFLRSDEEPGRRRAEVKSLVRKELLNRPPAGQHVAAKRNIFTAPGPFRPTDAERAIPPPDASPANQAATSMKSSALHLELSYIGYVVTGTRIVGLVIFEGTTTAVSPGDFLRPDIEILRVTRDEVEVRGPGGKTVTISIEGEEQ